MQNLTDEKLISLRNNGFIVFPYYYKNNISGALNDCYVRETVVTKLKEAQNILPKDMRFLIYDGWHSLKLQQQLWNISYQNLLKNNPDLTEEEILNILSHLEEEPNTSNFLTGGIVGLTLVLPEGKYLDMGSQFNCKTNAAQTDFFNNKEEYEEISENRKLLSDTMQTVGFINNPFKWWQFSYGIAADSIKDSTALYDKIFSKIEKLAL